MQIDSVKSYPDTAVAKVSESGAQEADAGRGKDEGGKTQIIGVDTVGLHERSVNEDELQKSIDKILKTLMGDSTSLKYEVHKGTNTIMVKVVDNETQKVIREVPPEKMLDMVESIWKLVGIIMDKKA